MGPYGADNMPVAQPEQPARRGLPVPLARPVVTYVLLALIALVFLLETALGGSENNQTLLVMGAEVNYLVAAGDYWRLLASMFLHIGLLHIAFNGWALFILGRDVEAFYGSPRFTVIYFLSGLFGGVASYLFSAPDVLSAGASGAIFGLVGAEIAYFVQNRELFGRLGRRQLGNLAILVVINLAFGASPGSGINNFAHVGGLVGGLVLGLGLAPRYALEWSGLEPRLGNRTPLSLQVLAVTIVAVLLVWGVSLGNQKWAGSIPSGLGHGAAAPGLLILDHGFWAGNPESKS
jgi:rhomboid protease GluP